MSVAKKRRKRKTKEKTSNRKWIWIAVIVAGVMVLGVAGSSLLSSPAQQAVADSPATISVDETYTKYKAGAYLLDVRTQEDWKEYHIPGTNLIPLEELPERLSEVPQYKEVVVICSSGKLSHLGRYILLEAGYAQVISMDGGIIAWSNAGYPTVEGP